MCFFILIYTFFVSGSTQCIISVTKFITGKSCVVKSKMDFPHQIHLVKTNQSTVYMCIKERHLY